MSSAWAWLRRNALMIYAGFAVAYMLIPIVVIAVFSFGETPRDRLELLPRAAASRSSIGRTRSRSPS